MSVGMRLLFLDSGNEAVGLELAERVAAALGGGEA